MGTESDSSAPGRRSLWVVLTTNPLMVAAVAAMVSVSPTLYDKVWQASHGASRPKAVIEAQNIAWDRNPTCGTSQHIWQDGLHGTKVDATICNATGDILVATRSLSGKISQYFLTVEAAASGVDAGATTVAYAPFESAAHANTLPAGLTPRPDAAALPAGATPAPGIQLAQILCQKRIDDRTIVRHIETPQGCFDVYVDTYTGQEVRRVPVPCRSSC